jgi:hypothetical protein
LLEASGDPNHEESAHYVDWAGRAFDPAFFDLAMVNAALQGVR